MSNVATITALVLAARLVLAGFFLPSALGKFRDRAGFVRGTLDYAVLPEALARTFAAVLPPLELALALALLAGIALPVTALMLALLLLCFIVAVAINLRRGRAISCNCHGIAATRTISWGTIARNSMLLLLTLPLILGAPLALSVNGWIAQWRADRTLLTTFATALPILLLLAWSYMVIQLVEWATDLQMRLRQLRTRLGYRRSAR